MLPLGMVPGLVPNPLLYAYPFSPFLFPPSLLSNALLNATSPTRPPTSAAATQRIPPTISNGELPSKKETDMKTPLIVPQKDNGLTTMDCQQCGHKFKDLCELTVHMGKTGHCNNNSYKPGGNKSPTANTTTANRKFVRGQDMWIIGRNAEETQRIMSCMSCGESFRSLPELTLHMMQTEHYWKIAPPQQIRNMIRSSKSVNDMVRQSGSDLECTMCGSSFSSNTEYVTHVTQCSKNLKQQRGTDDIDDGNEDTTPKTVSSIWTPPVGTADIPSRRLPVKRKTISDKQSAQIWMPPTLPKKMKLEPRSTPPPKLSPPVNEEDGSGSIHMLEDFVMKHNQHEPKPIQVLKSVAEIAKTVKEEMRLKTGDDTTKQVPKEANTAPESEKCLLDPNSVPMLSANPLCQLQKLIEKQDRPSAVEKTEVLISAQRQEDPSVSTPLDEKDANLQDDKSDDEQSEQEATDHVEDDVEINVTDVEESSK